MDALDAKQARGLRAHLETCESCRRYLEEISTVKNKLSAVEIVPQVQASASFHQGWVGAVNAAHPGSVWEAIAGSLPSDLLTWRVALPALGATALVILALFTFTQRHVAPSRAQTSAHRIPPPALNADLSPTLSNYEMVADQSLEAFDELLNRQANRNLPWIPVNTASILAEANAVD